MGFFPLEVERSRLCFGDPHLLDGCSSCSAADSSLYSWRKTGVDIYFSYVDTGLRGTDAAILHLPLFRAIPASLMEAAEIDGASDIRTFTAIVLPLSGPPLITLAVVNLLWAWNELLLALVFLQSDEKKTLMVGITGFQSRYSLSIPTIMAGMTIATIPLVIVYIFGQRYFITGLTAGSVKGE